METVLHNMGIYETFVPHKWTGLTYKAVNKVKGGWSIPLTWETSNKTSVSLSFSKCSLPFDSGEYFIDVSINKEQSIILQRLEERCRELLESIRDDIFPRDKSISNFKGCFIKSSNGRYNNRLRIKYNKNNVDIIHEDIGRPDGDYSLLKIMPDKLQRGGVLSGTARILSLWVNDDGTKSMLNLYLSKAMYYTPAILSTPSSTYNKCLIDDSDDE